jgi:hypothetical protein
MPRTPGYAAQNRLLIYNEGEEAIPPFAVVKPTGTQWSNNLVALQVAQPDENFVQKYYINGPTTLGSDTGYGAAISDGEWPLWAQYNSSAGTPAYGQVWGPKAGEWTLEPNRPGFMIVGQPQSIGSGDAALNLVAVRPYEVTEIWVKLNAALSQGGKLANQPIYTGKPAGESGGGETDSGLVLPLLYDRLIDADSESGWELPSGAWVLAAWIDGYWYAVESSKCAIAPTGS